MKKLLCPIAFMFLASFTVTSCGNKEEKVDAEITTDTASSDVAAELKLLEVSIPSPVEMTNEISKTKLNYNKSLLNSSSKAGSYSTNYQKAANAGIFGADLGYIVSYSQAQDGIEYYNAINKLAKDLGLESVFDEELIKKMGENVDKKDTLLLMLDKAYYKAERNLRSNQRVSIATLISAGAWVEGVYLTTSVLKDKPKDDKNAVLYDRAWKYVASFNHVFALLDHYKKNSDCAKMLEDLKDLRPLVDRANDPNNGVLTEQDIAALHEKVSAARTKLIN